MDLEILLFLVSVMIMWPQSPSAVPSEYDGPHPSSPSILCTVWRDIHFRKNDTDLTVYSDVASYTQLGKSVKYYLINMYINSSM